MKKIAAIIFYLVLCASVAYTKTGAKDEIASNIKRCNLLIEDYKKPGRPQAEGNIERIRKEREMWRKLWQENKKGGD